MRLLQIAHIFPQYVESIRQRHGEAGDYAQVLDILSRHAGQGHILAPCLRQEKDAFLCFSNDSWGLGQWAKDKGLPTNVTRDDIILAQIEDHRTEILYSTCIGSMSWNLTRRLPSCVRLKIGWLGSKWVGSAGYFDAIVSNFPTMNARHANFGSRVEYFTPSYESIVDECDPRIKRSKPVFFSGCQARAHKERGQILNQLVNALGDKLTLSLLPSHYSWFAATPLGLLPPFNAIRLPKTTQHAATTPFFGRHLMEMFMQFKISFNFSCDYSGDDRGNYRCFEATSAGALLLSDAGTYPPGFIDGQTMVIYRGADDALIKIKDLLRNDKKRQRIAQAGQSMVRKLYSKDQQWVLFQNLCDRLS